ncbi:MAG: hypothetical protein D6692_09455 [Planctomycetota bacterium]|nr:MAG: hypothetical protein D6692_09455 [Planctomycetota bacterium]
MMRHRKLLAACVAPAALLALGACSSTENAPRHAGDIDALRADPSPAMHTLAERTHDRENRFTVTKDTNFRMISDDWDRFWMIDRPSRLTFYPKP